MLLLGGQARSEVHVAVAAHPRAHAQRPHGPHHRVQRARGEEHRHDGVHEELVRQIVAPFRTVRPGEFHLPSVRRLRLLEHAADVDRVEPVLREGVHERHADLHRRELETDPRHVVVV